MERTIHGLGGLAELAEELGRSLAPGTVVALSGPMGAGKTALVKEVCARMGVPRDSVRSPSFILVDVHDLPQGRVYHVDLYRAETEADLRSLDLEEILYDPAAIVFIEWPRLVLDRLPPGTIEVTLGFVAGGPDDRVVTTTIRGQGRQLPREAGGSC